MSNSQKNSVAEKNKELPDETGHFGPYGGRFVAETLMGPLQELETAYKKYKSDSSFQSTLREDLNKFVGRPSPLYFAERLTEQLG